MIPAPNSSLMSGPPPPMLSGLLLKNPDKVPVLGEVKPAGGAPDTGALFNQINVGMDDIKKSNYLI